MNQIITAHDIQTSLEALEVALFHEHNDDRWLQFLEVKSRFIKVLEKMETPVTER